MPKTVYIFEVHRIASHLSVKYAGRHQFRHWMNRRENCGQRECNTFSLLRFSVCLSFVYLQLKWNLWERKPAKYLTKENNRKFIGIHINREVCYCFFFFFLVCMLAQCDTQRTKLEAQLKSVLSPIRKYQTTTKYTISQSHFVCVCSFLVSKLRHFKFLSVLHRPEGGSSAINLWYSWAKTHSTLNSMASSPTKPSKNVYEYSGDPFSQTYHWRMWTETIW